MNTKAEKFQQYLKEKNITVFTVDEIQDDTLNTVVFRSHFDIQGNQLPVIVILDSSIYGIIRVLVVPKAVQEGNEVALQRLINQYNKQYKSFKYYIDDECNLILDTCILCRDGEVDGDMIYTMFDVLITHLQDAYKDTMKVIWQ